MKALVSLHDVMPETMDRVGSILQWLGGLGVPPVTLLVVPGKPWTPGQIESLRRLAGRGHTLAAHGWRHRTTPRGLRHRLHAAFLSRNVAEHLALDSAGILALLQRSHAWFADNRLPPPTLYVPPAWALGAVRPDDLARAPFRMIETTFGLIRPRDPGRAARPNRKPPLERLPLTGYEADTAVRAAFLRWWNQGQVRKAARRGKPLRLSIHPDDPTLRLADQLAAHLRTVREFGGYDGCRG
ncbi:MAG: polysaccharide deacetylase family protein [Puniceicoccaceae bacterium]